MSEITATDTLTGQELKVTEVQAALEQPSILPTRDALAHEWWAKSLDLVLAETRQMMAEADDRLQHLNIRRITPPAEPMPEPKKRGGWVPDVPSVLTELPPDPARQLAPDQLDADHNQRVRIAQSQRNRDTLATVHDRPATTVATPGRPSWWRRLLETITERWG